MPPRSLTRTTFTAVRSKNNRKGSGCVKGHSFAQVFTGLIAYATASGAGAYATLIVFPRRALYSPLPRLLILLLLPQEIFLRPVELFTPGSAGLISSGIIHATSAALNSSPAPSSPLGVMESAAPRTSCTDVMRLHVHSYSRAAPCCLYLPLAYIAPIAHLKIFFFWDCISPHTC